MPEAYSGRVADAAGESQFFAVIAIARVLGMRFSLWVRLILLAASFLVLAGCDGEMRASYATTAEARADGAVRRGWVPDVLPDSATAIAESHDVETSRGEGSFRFGSVDADSFRSKLQPASSEVGQRMFHDFDRLKRDDYNFYTVPGFALAVNREKRHACFVTDSKPR